LAAGEDVDADAADLRRFGVAAAVAAGHAPADVYQWPTGVLQHFTQLALARTRTQTLHNG
jgi:hypothetical protein